MAGVAGDGGCRNVTRGIYTGGPDTVVAACTGGGSNIAVIENCIFPRSKVGRRRGDVTGIAGHAGADVRGRGVNFAPHFAAAALMQTVVAGGTSYAPGFSVVKRYAAPASEAARGYMAGIARRGCGNVGERFSGLGGRVVAAVTTGAGYAIEVGVCERRPF